MQTPARKRAETLFAQFTSQVDRSTAATDVAETAKPAEAKVKARASGPKTLHLPSAQGSRLAPAK